MKRPTAHKKRVLKIFIGVAAAVLSLPVLALVTVVVSVSLLNRTNGAITSSGEKREYLLFVPESYDRAKATPLVISLHAAMSWPALQRNISQWNEAADEHGFIVVYPAGTGIGPKTWFMEGAENPSRMPDVLFIAELIDTLAATYNIDPTRIYADGLSNGGGMAFALSCTLSHRIAAIGAVAAAQSLSWSWCADSTPVPMIAFHGTADPLVPYNGAPPGWLTGRSRTSRRGRPFGRGEIGARRSPRTPRSPPTSHGANTRTVRTVHAWCPIRSRGVATPGPAASPFLNGWSGAPATASMPRARCGRSFVSASL